MTIIDTFGAATAPSRRPRPRYRLLINRRLASRPHVPNAAEALQALMQDADVFRVDEHDFLVAPLSPELLDIMIIAAGATEDDENGRDDDELGDEDTGPDDVGEPETYAEHGEISPTGEYGTSASINLLAEPPTAELPRSRREVVVQQSDGSRGIYRYERL